MKKFLILIASTALLTSSIAFADSSDMGMDNKACMNVAKACKAAGFERGSKEKKFWMGCMKPVLLGQSVKGVKVDADQVKACRNFKIDKMQSELKMLQDVK